MLNLVNKIKYAEGGVVGCGGVVVCNASSLRVLSNRVRGDNEDIVNAVTEFVPIKVAGHGDDGVSDYEGVGVSNTDEIVTGLSMQNSFIRNIKNKVRRVWEMPDFEYSRLEGRNKKAAIDHSVVVRQNYREVKQAVIDVDGVVFPERKWLGFDINNRAVMWKDVTNAMLVYFVDVKNLIRQSCIRGNVIDTYVELLKSDQLRMYGDDDLAEKSYFFSSICLDMVKNKDVRAIEVYVRRNVFAGSEFRYFHFPMCHLGHWTLVVYDTEDDSWKHFNPMRQRGDRADMHYNEAVLLKERMSTVMKQSLREFGLDEHSIEANFCQPLESVTKCPQQKPDSLDCGVLVCVIMRQYVYQGDIERSLQGFNCGVLHATMVKALINDPVRGMKN
ncbi:hypothetical protein LOK49_LG03G03837 [Camellia lanceoleosa]|uniref:Uncharacterized protein n=1 Tax=Camellia lanceoleosa TaxID=1840588 RepID=A0ACC0ID10_9ERIC|nr:hypothetical protein LOK49_LG03G03837 [Camellia lanceoleosa]